MIIDIKYLNRLIDECNYSELFQVVDNHQVPNSYINPYNSLRNEFITEKDRGHDFSQRLRTLINSFVLNHRKFLNIVVITCNEQQIQTYIDQIILNVASSESEGWKSFKKLDVPIRYGKELEDWKPYKKESISNLLNFFKQKVNVDINIQIKSFKNSEQADDYIFKLNGKEKDLILIVDVFALKFIPNSEVAKQFDNKNMGGCIIPICDSLNSIIKKYMQGIVSQTFRKVLCRCIHKYSDYIDCQDAGYVYIDLEVPNKHSFFRKLNQIIWFKHPAKQIKHTDLEIYDNPEAL